ncbi:3-hydroxy-3-methylglutaryl-coenzyme A reductase-like, partial [Macrosteles quadrilineatus]|uniref:3-hydroxy-3-methylglutaryl-coenzyme A reductase-like n=1 Tax=Macrosteles quadrilineatus TaxID=74068 RepID=UPI0023E17975
VDSRWALKGSSEEHTVLPLVSDNIGTNSTDDAAVIQGQFIRWITGSADHIVILILLLALTVKFIFFEDKEELTEQFLMSSATAALQERHHERKFSTFINYKLMR